MTRSKISSKLAGPMWAAFRRHCHRLLAIGYQQALPQIHNGPDEETDVTGYICEAIENWLRTNSDDKEFEMLYVKDDPPLCGNRRTGKRRLRADIIIGYAKGSRPEFFFEAKRLHRTKAIASGYTGEGGMGCFISGRYASQWQEAAMIGYVQSDSLEHWQTVLQAKIEAGQSELKMDRIDKRVSFQDSFPLEWASFHQREGVATVKLFHILLDCRKSDVTAEQQIPGLLNKQFR